jgi:hypothetical protein
MGLIETGGLLVATPDGGYARAGGMELVYNCDGCGAGTVVIAEQDGSYDDSRAKGWTFFWDEPDQPCTRSFCPKCA